MLFKLHLFTARNLVISFSGKLLKIVATRCHILKRKCTKFDFGWGLAPDPTGGAYSVPPGPLAVFRGPTCKGRRGDRMAGEGRERKQRGDGREGRRGERTEEQKEGGSSSFALGRKKKSRRLWSLGRRLVAYAVA